MDKFTVTWHDSVRFMNSRNHALFLSWLLTYIVLLNLMAFTGPLSLSPAFIPTPGELLLFTPQPYMGGWFHPPTLHGWLLSPIFPRFLPDWVNTSLDAFTLFLSNCQFLHSGNKLTDRNRCKENPLQSHSNLSSCKNRKKLLKMHGVCLNCSWGLSTLQG